MMSCLSNFYNIIINMIFISAIMFCTSVSAKTIDNNCQLKLQYHKDLIDHHDSIISRKYADEIKNLETLLATVGCKLVKVEVPPGRGFVLMEEGQLDVMIAITKNPERLKSFHFVGPHGRERNWLIGPKNKLLTISNFAELERSKLTMSATKSSFYGEEFEKVKKSAQFNKRLFLVANNKQKIDLLIKGRVDLAVENEYVIADMVSSGIFDQLNLSKLFLVNDCHIYYAFSKKTISNTLANNLQKSWEQLNLAEQ